MVEKSEKIKVAMVTAAAMACDFLDKNPNADTEHLMQFIMQQMRVKGDEKVGAIVGASRAMKEKQNTGSTNKVIVQGIMDRANEILLTIGEN